MKTPITADPPPFQNNRIVPEELEFLWHKMQRRVEDNFALPSYGLHSKSLHTFFTEAPTPSSSKSLPCKRWKLFSKKSSTIALTHPDDNIVTPGLTRKRPNVLKKPVKSTPPFNLRCTELGRVPVGPCFMHVPDLSLPPTASVLSVGDVPADTRTSESGMYFTVDPSWDPSQGDADMYLLPFPDAVLETVVKDTIKTRAVKAPRSLKSVENTDNETSFLFLK